MATIESPTNSTFKALKSLLTAKGIKKNNLCIISGRKIVPEYINNHATDHVIATEKNLNLINITNKNKVITLKQSLFNQLDVCGSKFPLLTFKTPKINEYNFNEKPQGLEVISALGDPSNLGALVRSGDAFNISKLILLKNSSHPYLPKVIKASSGSIFKVPLFYGPFISELPCNSFYCLDRSGENINKFQWPKNLRLLMGEEGPGFPSSISPIKYLSIPMNPKLESLNATIASSIALNSYYQHYN